MIIDIQNHMKHIKNSRLPFVFLLGAAAIGASFFLGNNHNLSDSSNIFRAQASNIFDW